MLEQSGKNGFELLAPRMKAAKADARVRVVGPLRKVVRRMTRRQRSRKDLCKVLAKKGDDAKMMHQPSGKSKPQQEQEEPASDPIVRPKCTQLMMLHEESGKDGNKSLAPKVFKVRKMRLRPSGKSKPAPPPPQQQEPASDPIVFVKDDRVTRRRKRRRIEEYDDHGRTGGPPCPRSR